MGANPWNEWPKTPPAHERPKDAPGTRPFLDDVRKQQQEDKRAAREAKVKAAKKAAKKKEK